MAASSAFSFFAGIEGSFTSGLNLWPSGARLLLLYTFPAQLRRGCFPGPWVNRCFLADCFSPFPAPPKRFSLCRVSFFFQFRSASQMCLYSSRLASSVFPPPLLSPVKTQFVLSFLAGVFCGWVTVPFSFLTTIRGPFPSFLLGR